MERDHERSKAGKVKDVITGIKFLFSFFTILPVKITSQEDVTTEISMKSFLFALPFAGIVLALIVVAVYYVLYSLGLGVYSAFVSAVIYMALYGFLHTEAVIDVVDALYANHSGKSAYEIIKEPTVGAMGILYGISFVLLKVGALSYLLYNNLLLEIICVVLLGRFVILPILELFSFHERSSILMLMKQNMTLPFLMLITFVYTIIGIFLSGYIFIILLIASVFISLYMTRIMQQRLNFINGDVVGFILEITELILLNIVIFAFIFQ